MDDSLYGTRNKRGDYSPNEPAQYAPLFAWPPRPMALLKWLPSYFLPYNLLFALSAVLWWRFALPAPEVMKTLSFGWIFKLLVINCLAVFLFFGAFEWRLYVQRKQENRFKYNGKFPADTPSNLFYFTSQNKDNMLRTFLSGVPIWTAIEVVILHLFANGSLPWLTWAENPVYLFIFALLVPVLHETHFFLLHRLIHWGPLYTYVHCVHHNSINPSPWSSLSMHPIEHLGYLGVAFWHVILPSNPVLMLYQLHYAGFGAIPGHVGFDKVELTEDKAVDSHAYIHYLHHKYFEVNYGDGLIPFDKWIGTFHDGSKAGEERMNARYKIKKERMNAKKLAKEESQSKE